MRDLLIHGFAFIVIAGLLSGCAAGKIGRFYIECELHPTECNRRANMNQEQLTSLVRQLLLTAGGGLISAGYFSSSSWAVIASGIATLIVGSGWAFYTRRYQGLIASAATVPDVSKIVTTPTNANAIPSDKVVSQ